MQPDRPLPGIALMLAFCFLAPLADSTATLIGLAVFGDFPNGLALGGIAVTMSAGLCIVFRESALSRAR